VVDAATHPPAEARENGRSLRCFVKKWGPVLAFLVLGGGAWQSIRSCVGFGAHTVGIQTEAKAKEQQAENDATHAEIRGSLEVLNGKVDEATDYSRKTYDALPDKWKDK
jgi:hypothetical protein